VLSSVFLKLIRLLSYFPAGVHYRLADGFGVLLAIIPNRTRRLIKQNIRLCFPQDSDDIQKKLIRETITHSSYSIFELAAVWCRNVERVLDRVNESKICDAFHNSSRGRIVIVPHLGCWEVVNLWLAGQGTLMSLYKPQRNPVIDTFILNARSRNGAQLLATNITGLRQLSRGLKQGKTAMILPDQRPKENKTSHLSSFFGIPAPTTPLIHNLCKRIECDVFIATALRQQKPGGFDLVIEQLDQDILRSDLQSSLDYMNGSIEALVKTCPQQYQWGYARFPWSTYRTGR
jgi:KDO2-lipid IV(A) lauroyltransferase